VTGLSVTDVSQNAVANLGWDAVKLTAPVFAGDTLYAESEVLEVRPSKSRPDQGLVRVRTRGFNQRDETVITYERTVLVYSRTGRPRAG
jgi:itaconyl-CoA hydratase